MYDLILSKLILVQYCVFNAVRLWDVAHRRSVVRYVGHNYPVHGVDAWYDMIRTVENHGKKWQKNTAHFCENRKKNHGSLYSF